jgi:uncharacterized protein YjbI with pentapeptide repeats
MPLCNANLSDGSPCPKIIEEGKRFCLWHSWDDEAWVEIHMRLREATAEQKKDIVLVLISEHPEHKLELSPYADLRGADLRGMEFKGANLIHGKFEGANLEYTNFENATLSEAELQDAVLIHSDLSGATLTGANLQRVNASSANFRYATLKGANLQMANLVNANLEHANLRNANLKKTNLRGARFEETKFQEAMLYGCDLENAYLESAQLQGVSLKLTQFQSAHLRKANLQGADLEFANLQKANLEAADFSSANLIGVDLRDAHLEDANFHDVILSEAKLQGVDLSRVKNLSSAYLTGAKLDKTLIRREQLGDELPEERKRYYSYAKLAYLSLKQNFHELGDYEAASWAYRRERRMEKDEAAGDYILAISKHKWREALAHFFKFLSDTFVELLCDYGESVWRVIAWMAVLLFLIGPFMFSVLGGLVPYESFAQDLNALSSPWQKFWFTYSVFLLYSLDALTTASFSGLQPANDTVKLASGFFAIAGIVLAGLLGFVAGNRIRRS